MTDKVEELGHVYEELDEEGREKMVLILEERLEKGENDLSSEDVSVWK